MSNGNQKNAQYAPVNRVKDKSPTISDFFANVITFLLVIGIIASIIDGMNPFGITNNINVAAVFWIMDYMWPVLLIVIIQAVKNRE